MFVKQKKKKLNSKFQQSVRVKKCNSEKTYIFFKIKAKRVWFNEERKFAFLFFARNFFLYIENRKKNITIIM